MTFERANAALVLDSDEPGAHAFTAREWAGAGYTPVFQFGFSHQGREALDLNGTTLDLATFFASPPGPLEFAWSSGIIDPWENVTGHVTFGAGNSVADWSIAAVGSAPFGYSWEDVSKPVPFGGAWPDWVGNAEAFLDMPLYGTLYSEPNYYAFPSMPGRWAASISLSCHAEDGQVDPGLCLGPATLLSSALPPSPVPLPSPACCFSAAWRFSA